MFRARCIITQVRLELQIYTVVFRARDIHMIHTQVCLELFMCVCVFVRACVRAYVRACMRACVHACVCMNLCLACLELEISAYIVLS